MKGVEQPWMPSQNDEIQSQQVGCIGYSYLYRGVPRVGHLQRFIKDDRDACLVPYILLHLSAVALGIIAAVRRNRWWMLMSLIAAAWLCKRSAQC